MWRGGNTRRNRFQRECQLLTFLGTQLKACIYLPHHNFLLSGGPFQQRYSQMPNYAFQVQLPWSLRAEYGMRLLWTGESDSKFSMEIHRWNYTDLQNRSWKQSSWYFRWKVSANAWLFTSMVDYSTWTEDRSEQLWKSCRARTKLSWVH